MSSEDFLTLIKAKLQTISIIVLGFFALILIFTMVQPLKYGSESKLLVVQNHPLSTDPYAISKSNEYLSAILAQMVNSNLFFNDVLNSGFDINRNYFSKKANEKQEMKKWGETVTAKAIGDSGIIQINVYHPEKSQLEQISRAINYVLMSKHQAYHGAGDNITLKVIDKPIYSNWPVQPNILLNGILSILFGLVISFTYIYLFPDEKYDLKLWKKNKKSSESKQLVPELYQGLYSEEARSIHDNKSLGGIIFNDDLDN